MSNAILYTVLCIAAITAGNSWNANIFLVWAAGDVILVQSVAFIASAKLQSLGHQSSPLSNACNQKLHQHRVNSHSPLSPPHGNLA